MRRLEAKQFVRHEDGWPPVPVFRACANRAEVAAEAVRSALKNLCRELARRVADGAGGSIAWWIARNCGGWRRRSRGAGKEEEEVAGLPILALLTASIVRPFALVAEAAWVMLRLLRVRHPASLMRSGRRFWVKGMILLPFVSVIAPHWMAPVLHPRNARGCATAAIEFTDAGHLDYSAECTCQLTSARVSEWPSAGARAHDLGSHGGIFRHGYISRGGLGIAAARDFTRSQVRGAERGCVNRTMFSRLWLWA